MSATSGYFARVQQISGNWIHHAGGGFVVDQGDGVELPGRELSVDRLVIDRLPPLHLQRLGFLPAAARDIEPLVGERAAHAAEDALPNEIADRRLHHAPGRGGGKKNRLLRAKQFLQPRMDLAVKALKGFAAVANHRPGKSGEGFLRNLDRAGHEKLVVWNHEKERPTSNVQRPTLNSQTATGPRAALPAN